MSPARSSLYNDDCDGSPSDSGRSPECSQAWRKTPPARWGKSVHSRNVSGWPFCLTPLAWASPSRQCSQKGVAAGHGLLRRGEGSGDAAAVDGDVVLRQPVEEARAFWESQS
uniref:Uncharacterized protein n=1 Tax=Rhizophora mucronata TaxID=61149 RepID=A0A2P2J035_RHIMU